MAPNDKTNFISSDRINVSVKRELGYWCEKYRITPEEIKKVVDEVGPLVKDVEKRLRKKTPALHNR